MQKNKNERKIKMKKYVKPELFYERYELSQHIADCQWEMQMANENVCQAEPDQDPFFAPLEGGNLFTETAGCQIQNWEKYCYQPGSVGDIKVHIS